jgi:hypothetical protein
MRVVRAFDPRFRFQRSEDAEHDHQIALGEILQRMKAHVRPFEMHGFVPRRSWQVRGIADRRDAKPRWPRG